MTTPDEKREQWATLRRLFGVFAMIVFFWVGYEHNDSLWIFFARDYVDLSVPGLAHPVPPDQVQFLTRLFVLLMIPLFSWVLKKIDPEVRVLTATKKMLIGFGLAAVACGVMSAAGYLALSTSAKVSMGWLVAAYIILTAGEVLVVGTGLELSYAAAPKNLKGFVTACFLLTNTLANFINTWLCQLYGGSLTDPPDKRGPLSPGAFFAMTALIVTAATIGFFFVGRRLIARRPIRAPWRRSRGLKWRNQTCAAWNATARASRIAKNPGIIPSCE